MDKGGTYSQLTIYMGESDRWKGQNLATAIVELLHKERLAGATVLRGTMGFGANSLVHTVGILTLSSDLPVVITVIDCPERISGILSRLERMVQEGLIIRQEVQVIKYTASSALKQHSPPPVTKTTRNTYMLPKPLSYFDLLDAFQKPGCPVCHQIVERSRHGLGSLFYEQVTDVGTRQRLRASQGFCAWHAWMAT